MGLLTHSKYWTYSGKALAVSFIPAQEALAHMEAIMEANQANGPTLLHGYSMWLTLYDSYMPVSYKQILDVVQ